MDQIREDLERDSSIAKATAAPVAELSIAIPNAQKLLYRNKIMDNVTN
jgi:hypothetical protein